MALRYLYYQISSNPVTLTNDEFGQADAILGDPVLQKVTSSLCRNSAQKTPALDDVADAAVTVSLEMQHPYLEILIFSGDYPRATALVLRWSCESIGDG